MIKDAKIVASGVSYKTYSRQEEGCKRGDKNFIMSRGELMNFALNPKRWLDGYEASTETKATEYGSLIDMLALTPEKFDDHYAIAPATYSVEMMQCPKCKSITDSQSCAKCKEVRVKIQVNKEWNNAATYCIEWNAKQGDRAIIKTELLEKAKTAIKSLQADADVTELIACSERQVMCVATWKSDGVEVPLRVLIDLVPDAAHPTFGKFICNLKTARNGDPAIWANVIDDNTYDVSAALEMDIYTAATKEDRNTFAFPVQENVSPFHVVKPMPALTAEFLAYGRAKYQAALKLYANCLATGKWPSYSTGDRMVYGPVQLISPDSLWSYRQQAGFRGIEGDMPSPPKRDLGADPERPDLVL